MSTLSDWVRDAFTAVFDAVVVAIAVVVAAVIIAVGVVALAVVFVELLSLALEVLAVVLVLVIATLTLMTAAGVEAYRLGAKLGVDDLTRIRMVLAALAVACPALGLFILNRIADEASKPKPDVVPLRSNDVADGDAKAALAELESSVPDSLDDFLTQAGEVDIVGGAIETVVDIARIVHEDGSVAWIVTLPSTKDWVVAGDAGATNDLDADLLLLAFPGVPSQYEKAVLDAMAQAGIGAGEPVLVTGWSLGGILGGHLVESGAGGYDYAGSCGGGVPDRQPGHLRPSPCAGQAHRATPSIAPT